MRLVRPLVWAAAGLALSGIGWGAWSSAHPRNLGTAPAAVVRTAGLPAAPTRGSLADLQDRVRRNPRDAAALARLGFAYVDQARTTIDPSSYPKAQEALQRSLAIEPVQVDALAGMAALSSALHDFRAARTWAQRGLRLDPYSATLYGALDDALTQLGDYAGAEAATQKMLDLHPGVAAFTRGEYVLELRGDLPRARVALQQALSDASLPSDRAFVLHQLGALALSVGDAQTALTHDEAALAADRTSVLAANGRARGLAALGRDDAAVQAYAELVARVPQPSYLVEYGDLLASLGRRVEAQQQYDVFTTEVRLFEANGVTLDSDATLFYADHGDVPRALRYGEAGLASRPFVEMEDAYGWALHRAGRDREALAHLQRALRLGTRNALWSYHLGVVQEALGQRAAALTSLRRALQIAPRFDPLAAPLAQAAVVRLERS